jgi:hypothetical protein
MRKVTARTRIQFVELQKCRNVQQIWRLYRFLRIDWDILQRAICVKIITMKNQGKLGKFILIYEYVHRDHNYEKHFYSFDKTCWLLIYIYVFCPCVCYLIPPKQLDWFLWNAVCALQCWFGIDLPTYLFRGEGIKYFYDHAFKMYLFH